MTPDYLSNACTFFLIAAGLSLFMFAAASLIRTLSR
jgi:hypothetical protein